MRWLRTTVGGWGLWPASCTPSRLVREWVRGSQLSACRQLLHMPALGRLPLERIAPVVNVVRLTPSAFHLSWPRPTDASELTQYRVTVVDSASREQWTAEVVSASVGLCFSGLHSGRAYQVALTAAYADGSSASSGHRDIPKEGSSGGDDGCTAIIPATGTCVSCMHTHTGVWGGGHTVGGGGHTVFSFLTFGCWGVWFEVVCCVHW